MARSELVDVTVSKHAETDKAFLVSDDGDRENAVWVPKNQCEIEPKDKAKNIWELTLPEWLAQDKGFI